MKRYVIVGAGAAGTEAAREIRRQDETGDITIMDASDESKCCGIFRPALKEYLVGRIRERDLALLPHEVLENEDINVNNRKKDDGK